MSLCITKVYDIPLLCATNHAFVNLQDRCVFSDMFGGALVRNLTTSVAYRSVVLLLLNVRAEAIFEFCCISKQSSSPASPKSLVLFHVDTEFVSCFHEIIDFLARREGNSTSYERHTERDTELFNACCVSKGNWYR